METTPKEIQQKSPEITFNFIFAVFLVHRDDSSSEGIKKIKPSEEFIWKLAMEIFSVTS